MKRAALLLIPYSFLFFNLHSQIIHIPEDYPTIQQGINAAGEGDTVLVAPGTYYENLDFNYDNITLASHFLVTGDTSYISATVIDGSSLGSVILVRHYQDATTLICGFSIMSGESSYGGGLYIYNASPVLDHLNIYYNAAEYGGGIYLKSCHPVIRNCRIENNFASMYGGGIDCQTSATAALENVTITNNHSVVGGGGIYCYQNNALFLSGTDITYNHSGVGGGLAWYSPQSISFDTINRCNIYLNSADYRGSDLFSDQGTYEIIVDTFTVRYPTEFHAEEIGKFNFDILSGKILQIDADLYVSPSGNDTNTGLTPEDPLRTIRSAYSRLRADSGHINTVHLANGLYSPSTGQKFPLHMINYSSLAGESMEQTILDAEETNPTIILENDTIPMIEKLTIRGGNHDRGGGISSLYSEFHGRDLLLTGNSSTILGGGAYISNSDNSSLENSIVENNNSVDGGGIFVGESGIELHSVEFRNNLASLNGGGITIRECDSAIMSSLLFSNNQAYSVGGGLYAYQTSNLTISNSEFDSNTAADGGGVHSRYSSLEIINSLFTNNMGIHTGSGVELYGNLLPDSANIEARITNSTFAGNTTPALFCYNASVSLINNIFWGNAGPYQVQCQEPDTIADTLRVINSTIQDGINGIGITGIGPVEVIWHDGNLDSDPLFMEAGTDPFALDPGSPCIDAGTPDTSGLFLPYNDIIGNTRVWDGDGNGTYIIDMGAYESGAPVSLQEPGTQVINTSFETSIYPNPSSEKVTIQWLNSHGRMHISLLNSTGSHLQSFIIPPGPDKMVIDLKPFTRGIYFVLLKDESGAGNSEKLILIK